MSQVPRRLGISIESASCLNGDLSMSAARPVRNARRLGFCVLVLLLGSCSDVSGLESGDADLDGVITAVFNRDGVVRLRVGDLTQPAQGYGQIDLGVGDDARIVVQTASGGRSLGRSADLVVGVRIRAWSTGIELRSLPAQWEATQVEIVRRTSEAGEARLAP